MHKLLIIMVIIINSTASTIHPFPLDLDNLKSPWDDPLYAHIVQKLSKTQQKPFGNGRIIHGTPAALGQFPYAVFMLMKDAQNVSYGCGGSLIDRKWILTAAHCLKNRKQGLLLAGIVDLENGTAAWKEYFDESQMLIHPDFSMDLYFDNDIGLVKLGQNVPCHKNVGLVDLPCYCDSHDDLEGSVLTTTGFGNDDGISSSITLTMKYITAEIMPNCECKKFIPFPVFASQMCTSTASGMSSCFGDSGSALTASIKGRTVMVGIVSFGNGKCKTGNDYPNVFTRVSSYIDWIQATIKSNK